MDNLLWIAIGAILTLLIEWLIRGGIRLLGARFRRWWDGPAAGPFDDVLVLIRPREGGSHFYFMNAGSRVYRNMILRATYNDHSKFFGYSPYADGVTTIEQLKILRPGASIPIARLYLKEGELSMSWHATYDADSFARRLVDQIRRRKRETFGILELARAVGPSEPLQQYILQDVRGLFGLAPGYPNEPAPEIEAAILAISDEEARKVLRSKRTYDNPAPGVAIPVR
ncbi:hypothetical protein ACPPVW_14655 [Leifsonia sp. McL0607]|uniref:hypothetical protein n=1 Tax=Leifsonia sp. McL0607 TaxID=3415672 RepID=UPI003CE901A6